MPHTRTLAAPLLGFTVATLCSAGTLILACGSSSSNSNAGPSTGNDASTGLVDANGSSSNPDGGGNDSSPSISSDANACATPSATGYTTAAHGQLPGTVYGGGGILTTPSMVTFTFTDTFEPAQLAAIGNTLAQTSWFSQVTKDYCVPNGGPCPQGAPGASVAIDAGSATTWVDNSFNPPGFPNSDAGIDFSSFFLAELNKAVASKALSSIDPNAVYTFYFSPGATFYMGDPNLGGQPGCGFGGYHSAISQFEDGGGLPITYAIIVDCAQGSPAADELAQLTISSSHELVEATTDPYNGSGWYLDQDEYYLDSGVPTPSQLRSQAWADTNQFGEIADNCEDLLNPNWTLDGGGVVQRIWSSSAAAAGQNPCIPVPAGETFYDGTPDKAIYVADVGSTFTVNVTGFSPTPRPGWEIQAVDQTPSQLEDGGYEAPLLSMQFVGGVDGGNVAPGGSAIDCINNGTTVQLQVTLLADPAADPALNNDYTQPVWQQAEGALVSLDTSQKGQQGNGYVYYPYQLWPFAVVTPQIAATIGLTSAGLPDERRPVPPATDAARAKVHRTWERNVRNKRFQRPAAR